jgi:hypothetical protein
MYAAFYRDILELPNMNEKEVTATEINARLDQYLRQAAPVFVRIESDYNAALVNAVFEILLREEMLPPAPEALHDQEIEFEYESPIKAARDKAQALKLLEGAQAVLPFAEASPDLLDNIDFDVLTRMSLRGYGWPEAVFRPLEQMVQMREQRAKEAEMAKMAELMNKAGPAVAQLTQAGTGAFQSGMVGPQATSDGTLLPPAMDTGAPAPFDIEDIDFEDVA